MVLFKELEKQQQHRYFHFLIFGFARVRELLLLLIKKKSYNCCYATAKMPDSLIKQGFSATPLFSSVTIPFVKGYYSGLFSFVKCYYSFFQVLLFRLFFFRQGLLFQHITFFKGYYFYWLCAASHNSNT